MGAQGRRWEKERTKLRPEGIEEEDKLVAVHASSEIEAHGSVTGDKTVSVPKRRWEKGEKLTRQNRRIRCILPGRCGRDLRSNCVRKESFEKRGKGRTQPVTDFVSASLALERGERKSEFGPFQPNEPVRT